MIKYQELRNKIIKLYKIDLNSQSVFRIGIIKYYYNLQEVKKLNDYIEEVILNDKRY